jgi:D-alanyl-D-alanine dipeptidase
MTAPETLRWLRRWHQANPLLYLKMTPNSKCSSAHCGILRYDIGVNAQNVMRAILGILFCLLSAGMPAQDTPQKSKASDLALPRKYAKLLHGASQAMSVTTPDWNAVDGSLQRYEKRDGKWQPVGDRVAVVVGKSGLGWDHNVQPSPADVPVKKEGDGRSPAGVFGIGKAFGFAPVAPELKLNYLPLTDSVECVDDVSSRSYNRVVDRQQNANPDWNSSEKMRTVDVYKEGLEVNYNPQHVAGAGSCIFMHIWRGTGRGTAGCTAMEESKLLEIRSWLDPAKKPVLVQFPSALYRNVKVRWSLP